MSEPGKTTARYNRDYIKRIELCLELRNDEALFLRSRLRTGGLDNQALRDLTYFLERLRRRMLNRHEMFVGENLEFDGKLE